MRLKSSAALAALMRDRGYSHRRLAEAIDCHPSFIDHLTAGRKSTVAAGRADAMVRTLRCTVDTLFDAPEKSHE
ncbi:helix-turn-helix domain-containing protein [Nocardia carnea]|uniref:helix-turn-helix domain-containing protein n=1 Tax=Nocardia carnea TaxID=37328 RepID=UPI002458B2D1|nr:helix-turn-helix transcriptional regulator [Nocardia carnea]